MKTEANIDNGITSRVCLCCGVDITNKRKNAKFCSDKCRARFFIDNKKPTQEAEAPSVEGCQ